MTKVTKLTNFYHFCLGESAYLPTFLARKVSYNLYNSRKKNLQFTEKKSIIHGILFFFEFCVNKTTTFAADKSTDEQYG